MLSDTISMTMTISIFLGSLGLIAFIWALKTGQFDDVERYGHTPLYDDESELFAAQEKERRLKEQETKKQKEKKEE